MSTRKPSRLDRHRSAFLVRLPVALRAKLQELRSATHRPMTLLVVDALVQYLTAQGRWTRQDQKALDASIDRNGRQ